MVTNQSKGKDPQFLDQGKPETIVVNPTKPQDPPSSKLNKNRYYTLILAKRPRSDKAQGGTHLPIPVAQYEA